MTRGESTVGEKTFLVVGGRINKKLYHSREFSFPFCFYLPLIPISSIFCFLFIPSLQELDKRRKKWKENDVMTEFGKEEKRMSTENDRKKEENFERKNFKRMKREKFSMREKSERSIGVKKIQEDEVLDMG